MYIPWSVTVYANNCGIHLRNNHHLHNAHRLKDKKLPVTAAKCRYALNATAKQNIQVIHHAGLFLAFHIQSQADAGDFKTKQNIYL